MAFRPATKQKSRLRMALDGVSGSGKTLTALRAAMAIAKPGGKIAVINSESGAIEKYLGDVWDDVPIQFDIDELPDFAPTTYTAKIIEAGQLGYDVLIIDSLSHAWAGSGGALEIVDKGAGKSAFTSKDGWRKVTPMHNQMIEAILKSPCHVIATMRTKTEYILEETVNPQTGAKTSIPKKVGMKPVQREGMEYEFDVVGDLDDTHTFSVAKTRCSAIDGALCVKPGADFFRTLKIWLESGTEPAKNHYTTNIADLQSTKDIVSDELAEQGKLLADMARREQLLAMANQPAPTTAAQQEQPPFDPAPAHAAAAATPPADALPTEAQLQELVALGKMIKREPKDIFAQCKEFYGCGPDKLPQSKFVPLLESFRTCAANAQAEETAKNQQAA